MVTLDIHFISVIIGFIPGILAGVLLVSLFSTDTYYGGPL